MTSSNSGAGHAVISRKSRRPRRLLGRQVLIHSSAIAPLNLAVQEKRVLPMMSMGEALVVSVRLTKQQIEASPTMAVARAGAHRGGLEPTSARLGLNRRQPRETQNLGVCGPLHRLDL